MSTPNVFTQFEAFATAFVATEQPPQAVDGADYDMPGVAVYHTSTRKLPQNGRIEVNVVAPEAQEAFEWGVEITLKDKVAEQFIHLILRHDGSVVETYGKTVLPVSPQRATEILEALARAGS